MMQYVEIARELDKSSLKPTENLSNKHGPQEKAQSSQDVRKSLTFSKRFMNIKPGQSSNPESLARGNSGNSSLETVEGKAASGNKQSVIDRIA